jgi:rhodanese-related sulfurtransferase
MMFWVVPVAAEDLMVDAVAAMEQVNRDDAVLIDIRQPEEWRETGMAPDAIGISMRHPGGADGFITDLLEAVNGDRDASIVLICRTGNRTAQVAEFLRERGFGNVRHVGEGMLGSRHGPGWIHSGLPVEACAVC